MEVQFSALSLAECWKGDIPESSLTWKIIAHPTAKRSGNTDTINNVNTNADKTRDLLALHCFAIRLMYQYRVVSAKDVIKNTEVGLDG